MLTPHGYTYNHLGAQASITVRGVTVRYGYTFIFLRTPTHNSDSALSCFWGG